MIEKLEKTREVLIRKSKQSEGTKNFKKKMNILLKFFLLINLPLVFSEFIFNPKAISSVQLNIIDNLTSFFFAVTDNSSHAFVSMTDGGVYVLSLVDI